MNLYTKLILIVCAYADEPNADCRDVEIGLVCRSDCEDLCITCIKTCYGDEGFEDIDCERSCIVDLLSCEEHCPCFAECPNGCPCDNIDVDQKYC